MKKTMKELMTMYQDEKFPVGTPHALHAWHSTQRDFIYDDITVEKEDGPVTKAGDVIRSILQEGIQLPALYFWSVQDDDADIHYAEDEYNIHDGKQRFLSIYKFIRCQGVTTRLINPVTKESGEYGWMDLTKDQQQLLLNYTFDIVVRTGTQREEEKSFRLINGTGEELTEYERIRGAYHGKYISSFEDYIELKGKSLTKIRTHVGRGEQAIYLLLLATDRFDGTKTDKNKAALFNKLADKLGDIRNKDFDPTENKFDKAIELYNELCLVLSKSNNEKNPVKICRIVRYIIKKSYPVKKILDYYNKITKQVNDVDAWKFGTHKTALDRLCLDNIECDGLRFFPTEIKSTLFKADPVCCECKEVFSDFRDSAVDHIKPWSLGGRTEETNARLICTSCNSSKSNTYDEEGEY